MEGVVVRAMTEADFPAVLAIEEVAYPFPWSRQIFVDSMEAGTLLVVMERAGEVVGYGVQSNVAGESQLLNLAVHPQFQGKGLGRYLLQWLIQRATEADSEMMFLEVRLSNRKAQQLYLDLGFNEIGMRKSYYRVKEGQREDALIFALQIFSGSLPF